MLEGRYRIVAPLGEGGMGVVYRAEHLKLGRAVAVKVLLPEYGSRPELRARFEREAKVLASVSHPHLVSLLDFGVDGETAYLVMELLEGETLKDRLARGPLGTGAALRLARQVLAGLAHLHAVGMVHRDLKPANVFLQRLAREGGGEDHVRILDFGLAKFLTGDARRDGPALTATGAVFGTAAYMAPEQAAGGEVGPRADVYAAGVLLFELLAGRRPFVGERHEVVRQHLLTPPPRVAEVRAELRRARPELASTFAEPVPEAVEALVARALAKEQAARFAHAGELLAALEREVDRTSLEGALTYGSGAPASAPALAPVSGPPPAEAEVTRAAGPRPGRQSAAGQGAAATASPAAATAALPLVRPRATRAGRAVRSARALVISGALALGMAAIGGVAIWRSLGPGRHGGEAPTADPRAPGREHAGVGAVDRVRTAGDVPSRAGAVPARDVSDERAPGPRAAEPDVRASEDAAPLVRDPWAAELPELLASARRAHAEGRPTGPALDRTLQSWHRVHPGDVRGGLLLAHTFCLRGWRPDCVDQYRLAFVRDPAAARGDPAMLEDLVALVAHGSVAPSAADLLVEAYGGRETVAAPLAHLDVTLATGRLDDDARARLWALRDRLAPP